MGLAGALRRAPRERPGLGAGGEGGA